jgi:trimeric autotransporter adhesin
MNVSPARARAAIAAMVVPLLLVGWAPPVIGATGDIRTFAGGGPLPALQFGLSVYGVTARGADVYLAAQGPFAILRLDTATNRLWRVAGDHTTTSGPDGVPATETGVVSWRVEFDSSGHIYVGDLAGSRLRRIDAVTGIISTVAGNGTHGYSGDGGPATAAAMTAAVGIALDSSDNVYFADQTNHRVRRVDAVTGIITTFAGNGTKGYNGDGILATSASLNTPGGLAFDSANNLFIADGNHRIRRVDAGTGIITTVAGNGTAAFAGDGGPATSASLFAPSDVAFDGAENLYITDAINARVRRVTAATGIITTIAGNGQRGTAGDGGPATSAQLDHPRGVSVDSAGAVYIGDNFALKVRKVGTDGIIRRVAGDGTCCTSAIAAYGFAGDGGPADEAAMRSPHGVAVGADGTTYIADTNNNRVRKVTPSGTISTLPGVLLTPKGVAVDAAGNVYIADTGKNRVRKVTPAGAVSTVAGTGAAGSTGDGGPAIAARLRKPGGVAIDSSGNVYIADTGNNKVRRVNPAGVITTLAGTGDAGSGGDGRPALRAKLNKPGGVAIDSAGVVYVVDTGNNKIRTVSTVGIITTYAGNGFYGFTGDGVAATATRLASPNGVAFASDGTVFIADTNNHRVRRVDAAGIITTVAGSGTNGFSGDGRPATSAKLSFPWSVAARPDGSILFADRTNNRIRAVSG